MGILYTFATLPPDYTPEDKNGHSFFLIVAATPANLNIGDAFDALPKCGQSFFLNSNTKWASKWGIERKPSNYAIAGWVQKGG